MRVGTLFQNDTADWLAQRFLLVSHNQLPELYCQQRAIDPAASELATQGGHSDRSSSPYPAAQLVTAREGSGGGNVRTFFCTPQGRVVSYLSGRWLPPRYTSEASWSLQQFGLSRKELIEVHRARTALLQQARDAVLSPDELTALQAELGPQGQPSPRYTEEQERIYQVMAFNRLIRSHQEVEDYLLRPVSEVLQEIEDQVYTRGAIG